MRFTRFGFRGAVFYATMLVAFFAAPYSNLFFLLLGFLTVLGVGSVFTGRRNLQDIEVAGDEFEPVPSGTDVRVNLAVNASRGTRFALAGQITLRGKLKLRGRLDVLRGRGTITLKADSLSRGVYPIERAFLESRYPFGLFWLRRRFATESELLVYPTPARLFEGRSPAESLDELLGTSPAGGRELEPVGLRDHREGDGMRAIHWRASARRSKLVVQEWEGGSRLALEVVLDRRCPQDELESALTVISAMVHLGRTNKETLRLHSQDLSATFGEGHRPWPEALEFLARAKTLPTDAAAPPATSPRVPRLPRVLDHA